MPVSLKVRTKGGAYCGQVLPGAYLSSLCNGALRGQSLGGGMVGEGSLVRGRGGQSDL